MTVGGLSVKYDRWGEGGEREREREGCLVCTDSKGSWNFIPLLGSRLVGVFGVSYCLWCQSRGPHVLVPPT